MQTSEYTETEIETEAVGVIPITVAVTDDDIRYGVRGSCHHCPIARAVSRACWGLALVEVSPSSIYIGQRRWDTPDDAKRFMTLFDATSEGQPFTFELGAAS